MIVGRRARAFAGLGCALAAAGALVVPADAVAQAFVPARLLALEGKEDFTCPRVERQSSVLICQAVVDDAGHVRNEQGTHCFGNIDDDRNRADFLRKKVLRSQFEPASIDGEAVAAYVSFRVVYQGESGRCDVGVLANLGFEQDRLGVGYVAPQEIFTDGGWLRSIEGGGLRYEGSWQRPYKGIAFAMSVAVDERGNASDGRVETINFVTEDSARRAVEALQRQRFIPAIVDGVPRPARYFEFMYVPGPAPLRRR